MFNTNLINFFGVDNMDVDTKISFLSLKLFEKL